MVNQIGSDFNNVGNFFIYYDTNSFKHEPIQKLDTNGVKKI